MDEFEQPIIIGGTQPEPPIVFDPDFEEPISIGESIFNTDPIVSQGVDNSSYTDLNNIFSQYNRKLTKEDILKDDRLMDVIRTNLEARFTPGGALTKARRGLTGLSGGAIGGLSSQDYRDMSDEDVFEIWQNYQRSFSGGQTVTTANEIAYGMGADDTIKAQLGAGYLLFDQMDNAFTGEGSWAEMGDAIWDYGKSAVYDPSTILSLGLGKILGWGGTKAGSAAARSMMTKAYQNQIKKGVTKKTALSNIGTAAAKSLPYATADAIIGAGVDVAYQMQLIDVGAQEEYSKLQTSFAALGSLVVIPTLVSLGATAKELRKSPYAPQFLAYKEFDKTALKLSADEAEKQLNKRVIKGMVLDSVDENFGLVRGDTKNFLEWAEFRRKAKDRVTVRGERYTDDEITNAFFQQFFLGSVDGSTKGYYQVLKEAGFVLHPAMKEKYGTAGAFAQTIKFLTPAKVKSVVKKFEDDTGYKLRFMDAEGNIVTGDKVTPVSLAAHFGRQASVAGESLWLSSHLSRLEKSGVNVKDAIDIAAGKTKPTEDPKRLQYLLSVYKRLITSHLSTTGANVKGFTQLVSLNSVADIFTASVNLGQSGVAKMMGDTAAAEVFYNRAYGSLFGALRRGADVFSPDIPIEYADKILALNPEEAAKLFRDVAGDGGVRDALTDFNLDPNNVIYKGVDVTTKGAQTVSMVRLQDDLTKRWAFGTNVNQAIMRAYGQTPEEFFKRSDAALEMASDKFQKEVLDKAVFRTLRETASVNWSSLPGKESLISARTWAKGFEFFTNRTPVGFVVPFGSFLNTTAATMGDLTGINALRFGIKRMTGKELDFATREGAESLGRMAAGWSIITLGVYARGGGKDRIENNLAYNQDLQDDGSIQDRRYDWPLSTMRLLSQIAAHGMGDSNNITDIKFDNIPSDLLKELGTQIGGQSVRDLDEVGQTMIYASEQLIEGNAQPLIEMMAGAGSRIVNGMTRPLDPVNQVVGIVTDSNMNPDLRQGAEFQNQMLRYVNNIIGGTEDAPRRSTPTRGSQYIPDIGKQILGNRTLQTPNLVEKMMNAAGKPYWKSIRFDGPAEIRNKMDGLAAPFFEAAAIEYLKKNPNYFELPQQDKEKILNQMAVEVRANVLSTMEAGMPRSINVLRLLTNKNKKQVKNVMEFLNIEGPLEDVLQQEDALQKLLKIQALVDNYDDIFYGDLNLD